MPDLTTIDTWMCESNEDWAVTVPSSTPGKTYTVRFGMVFDPRLAYDHDYSCDCPAGQHGRKCKHIEAAKPKHCQWHGAYDDGEVTDGKCPRCGGPVQAVRVAV